MREGGYYSLLHYLVAVYSTGACPANASRAPARSWSNNAKNVVPTGIPVTVHGITARPPCSTDNDILLDSNGHEQKP